MSDLTPLPQKPSFSNKFKEYYRELMGGEEEFEEFLKYSSSYPDRFIRINTLKKGVEEVEERLSDEWVLEQVPWCSHAFRVKPRGHDNYDIGNTLEHQLGYFYVQDAASLIPSLVLDPDEDDHVLDITAAPGSKTTHLAQLMQNNGAIVANDANTSRVIALASNLQRCGVYNTLITTSRAESFKDRKILFDKILVDAPCSATGTIRKSSKSLEMWGGNFVNKMKNIQKSILASAFSSLKEGGLMVYSTCTLEPEENEGVVSWLLNEFPTAGLKSFSLDVERTEPVKEFKGEEYSGEVEKCLRINPQDNNTEGFFVALIQKKG